MAPVAVEQAPAKVFLQQAEGAREGGLRDMGQLGGAAEAGGLGDQPELAQDGQAGHADGRQGRGGHQA